MKLLKENRLISYRVVWLLASEIQEVIWKFFYRMEKQYGKLLPNQLELKLVMNEEFVEIQALWDDSTIRYYHNMQLDRAVLYINIWELSPYKAMDVLNVRYEDGGRLDAR